MTAKYLLIFLNAEVYFFTEESVPRTQVERRKTSPYFSSKYSKEGIVFREIHFFNGEGIG